ncbi:MAG: hypothetical protein UT28_C0001G0716 [Berkelbacteria bacterium GW2011_GWE1_39_12]|uniref:DUF218 domain-containing protein n=1 Tax=Berkelbacteria bacterium GW2011_GWE1_39_12 TaxID=1618337 RepID=A0A0G4B522_9BACT|nr:MAG: hypothetical protein UT28_C0001G0716 [Berkelbacteria bacterium GW2011_GWE1_39_12]
MHEKIDRLGKIIWEYHHLNQPLVKAGAIFVLGSIDKTVGEYAAELFLKGYAPLMIFSGGMAHNNDLLSTGWNKSEAEVLSEIAIEKGVPKEKIILETNASNTSENINFVKKLLAERQLDISSFILVQKPYMERRAYATFKKQWPEKEFIVTSSPVTYEDYMIKSKIPKEQTINIMVGDLQRIKEYPNKGFQITRKSLIRSGMLTKN